MKNYLKLIALLSVLFLISCSTANKNAPIAYNPSFKDMSLALRTMSLSGNGNYFVDVDKSYYSDDFNGSFDSTTPVVDILASAGFFTDQLGFTNSQLLSNNQVGGIQLALGIFKGAHRKANIDRLNEKVFAWIPKSIAPTKEQAEALFLSTAHDAIMTLIGKDIKNLRIEHFDVQNVKGISYFTDEKMYLEGKGYFEQGKYKNLGIPKKANVFITDVKSSFQDPSGQRSDSFYIEGGVHFWNTEKETNQVRTITDLIEFSRLMPEWYYQFLFIDKVPVVLSSEAINLFMQPIKKSAHHASTSSD